MTRKPTELFDCDRVSSYLESYLLGQVPPPERRGMRLHIHGCPACLEKVMARDPLQLFAPLADETPTEGLWNDFWPAIQDEIKRQEAAASAVSRWPRRSWLSAAALVITLSAAAAALYLTPRWKQGAQVADAPQHATQIAAGMPSVTMPQTVERVRATGPDDVQVYTMTWSRDGHEPRGAADGAAPETPAAELILIVDKGLDL